MEESLRLSVERRLRELLVSELNVNAATLAAGHADTPLLGHGIGLDSVAILELVVCLEQEFRISVPDNELTADLFKNIGTLADYVFQSIAKKNRHDSQ